MIEANTSGAQLWLLASPQPQDLQREKLSTADAYLLSLLQPLSRPSNGKSTVEGPCQQQAPATALSPSIGKVGCFQSTCRRGSFQGRVALPCACATSVSRFLRYAYVTSRSARTFFHPGKHKCVEGRSSKGQTSAVSHMGHHWQQVRSRTATNVVCVQ